MLYIDGISLNKIKDEFKDKILNKKIGKITQESELSISLSFGKTNLIISCSQSFPIIYISDSKIQGINENFSFFLSLKKYLLNAQLMDIEQVGLDRILLFKFSKLNELGENRLYNLYFEFIGRYSNIILTDSDNKILELCKRISIEDSNQRILLTHGTYEPPLSINKKSPLNITESEYSESYPEFSQIYEGVGGQLSKNIRSVKDLADVIDSPISPKIYMKDSKIILGTVLERVKPSDYTHVLEFDSFSEMVEKYIESMSLSSAVDNYLNTIITTLKRRIKKSENILKNIAKDDLEKADYIKYKEIGDILSANLYSLKKYSDSVELFDFYNNVPITIPLDIRGTPQKNIDNYYKKYNKMKRGLESNITRTKVVQSELDYLESSLDFATRDTSVDNLRGIIKELETLGYLKEGNKKKMKNKKVVIKPSFHIAFQDENISIIYGKNNTENDYVTFKIGDKTDLWFHVKDIPGSHVILKCDSQFITDALIFQAAQTAVNFSKVPSGNKALVEYTQRRFVTKPNGSKPGFVIYTNQKTIALIKE